MSASLAPSAFASTRPHMPLEINVNEPGDVEYWVERFGVSEQSLRQAIADVGVSAQEVGEHLGKM